MRDVTSDGLNVTASMATGQWGHKSSGVRAGWIRWHERHRSMGTRHAPRRTMLEVLGGWSSCRCPRSREVQRLRRMIRGRSCERLALAGLSHLLLCGRALRVLSVRVASMFERFHLLLGRRCSRRRRLHQKACRFRRRRRWQHPFRSLHCCRRKPTSGCLRTRGQLIQRWWRRVDWPLQWSWG